MPDLKADTSFYNKQQQSPGSIIDLVNGIEKLQTSRAIGDATQAAIGQDGNYDPNTALQVLRSDPRYRRGTPSDITTAITAGQGQLSMNTATAASVAQEMDALVAKGDHVTQEDINRTRAIIARRSGPQGVAVFDQFLGPGTNPGNVQGRISQAKSGLGIPQTRTTVPTPAGTAEQPTPQADFEAQAGAGGGRGGRGITVTAPRAGMTSGGPAGEGEEPIDVGPTPHPRGSIPDTTVPASYKADQEQAADITNKTAPLVNALASLGKLDKDSFGPGSQARNTFNKIFQTWGLGDQYIKEGESKTGAYDKVVKAIHQYNQTLSGGGDTDARMFEKIAGNPNASMETATIKDLLKVNLGLERMRAATVNEYKDYQKGGRYGKDWAPSEYNVFKGEFGKQLDQRAFVFDMMTPDNARQFLKSLKPGDERRRFDKSLALSDKHIIQAPKGWYTP